MKNADRDHGKATGIKIVGDGDIEQILKALRKMIERSIDVRPIDRRIPLDGINPNN